MAGIRARVQAGRLVVDEPTDLPEGTVLDLVVDDEGDSLDAADRVALDATIAAAWRSLREGQGRVAADVLADLPHPTVPGVRRTMLRATRHHVYYVPSGDLVQAVAVWGAIKGAGPDLAALE